MLVAAGKYSSVRALARNQPRKAPHTAAGNTGTIPGRPSKTDMLRQVEISQQPARGIDERSKEEKEIDLMADLNQLQTQRKLFERGVNILLPQPSKVFRYDEWAWQGMRTGGWLERYMEAEKHQSKD